MVGDVEALEKPIILNKHIEAFKTIGEVSELLNIPQHVIRFWETKFPEVSPVKNKTRRYYTPKDLKVLELIKTLLYRDGYTIKGVQNYLVTNPISKNDPEPGRHLFSAAPAAAALVEQKPALDKNRLKEVLKNLCDIRDRLAVIVS